MLKKKIAQETNKDIFIQQCLKIHIFNLLAIISVSVIARDIESISFGMFHQYTPPSSIDVNIQA